MISGKHAESKVIASRVENTLPLAPALATHQLSGVTLSV